MHLQKHAQLICIPVFCFLLWQTVAHHQRLLTRWFFSTPIHSWDQGQRTFAMLASGCTILESSSVSFLGGRHNRNVWQVNVENAKLFYTVSIYLVYSVLKRNHLFFIKNHSTRVQKPSTLYTVDKQANTECGSDLQNGQSRNKGGWRCEHSILITNMIYSTCIMILKWF